MDCSAQRIWGDHYERVYKVPKDQKPQRNLRHFLFLFKETTFECVAGGLAVTTHERPYQEVVQEVLERYLAEG